ncbi:MAG TPA: DUF2059 domain-containing protein [Thermoanaerobaculia bacterium]|nr:DUF2059 domain-containing protein [Thermoanaerobaculia bacterium]
MKTLMRIALVACLLVSALTVSAEQKVAGAKEQKVRRLLKLIKAEAMATQMLDAMMGSMQANMQAGSDEFWQSFKSQVKADELMELLVPVYADNLDEADIDGLIQFYESPVGQKFVSKQGIIIEQSMAVGQKWGEAVAEKAIRQLQKTPDE